MTALQLKQHDAVAEVRLDRPDKLNALGPEFWAEMAPLFTEIEGDRSIRAVVITAAGRSFCAGLDLGKMISKLPVDPAGGPPDGLRQAQFHQMIRDMQGAITCVERCRVPVIAAIQGHCLGGGLDLACACDIRLAAADAVFGVRETKMAMVADLGTLQRLPAIVGAGRARELAFTGRDVDAAAAEAMGLVNRVCDDPEALRAAALALAEEIAGNAPLAVEGTKQVMNHGVVEDIDRGLEYVATWNAGHFLTQDLGMALTAFVSKQTPEFSGR